MRFDDVSQQIGEVALSYQYHKPPPVLISLQEKIAQAIRALVDWLNSLHIRLPGSTDTSFVGNLLEYSIVAVGFAGALYLIYFAWSRLGHLKQQSRIARKGALASEQLLDSLSWQKQASEFALNGDWRNACRALYLSALRLLSEREIAPFNPTRTNYEYWYALATRPPLQRPFKDLAGLVEEIWFGDLVAEEGHYQVCLAALSSLGQSLSVNDNGQSKINARRD